MYGGIYDGKTLDDVLLNEIQCNCWLSMKQSGQLTEDEIFKIIDNFGYIENLIIFHLNEYFKLQGSSLLKRMFDRKKFPKYFIYSTKHKLLELLSKEQLRIIINYYKRNYKRIDGDKYLISYYLISEYIKRGISRANLVSLLKFIKQFLSEESADYNCLEMLYSLWHTHQWCEKRSKQMLNDMYNLCGVKYDLIYNNKDSCNAIIAYKGVEYDNTSVLTDRVIYLPGNEYETYCDTNIMNENSFGLSAWDYNQAKQFCSKKILKVLINLKDLRYINLRDGKLRATKFKVLEEIEIN